MIRKIVLLLALTLVSGQIFSRNVSYDIIIVGGTPGGIMAAVSAARAGKTALILERSQRVGGLPANGLGATDIATRGATNGIFKEYVDRVRQYYESTYGEGSQQLIDCSDGYHFEPKVAEIVFDGMLRECGDRVTVLTMRQFDCDPENLDVTDGSIRSIRVKNRNSGEVEEYEGGIFIDATYEGDLGAAAGVPFRVGREDASEFGEIGAGKLYKYWDGRSGEGSTGQGDNAVQAYNYRLCLTKDPKNRVEFRKPARYNRDEYVSLVGDVLYGRHTNYTMENVTMEQQEANRKAILKGGATMTDGDVWGVAKLTNMVVLPNSKTDANNQHLAFISTDLPEENWPWPTASWEWRDRFAVRLQEYIEGLFWFAANDRALPESFRKAVSEWGYAADEYEDNGNFPRQVYVREGRRFEGEYFFTANDALGRFPGERPVVHKSSVTASHYMLDSHAVLKREKGRVHLDGFFSYPSDVYTVPYGVMVSGKVDNLLFPVPVSGSHVGFSTLRMEPCWMALGQAAGVAASIALDKGVKVVNVPMDELQDSLIDAGATLVYFRDIRPGDEDYAMVQKLALLGFIPEWDADLDGCVDDEMLSGWKRLSQKPLGDIRTGMSRRDAFKVLYMEMGL